IREVDSWRTARAPAGLAPDDLAGRASALAESLREFFRLREGTGRFCSVTGYRLPQSYCFVGQVADRLQYVETFADDGRPALQPVRPALPVLFVYYPGDGTVLLKSHLRAADRVG